MKFFIGRSHTFWVVQPKTGKVRKLPLASIALSSLFLLMVSFFTASAAMTFDKYSGGLLYVSDSLRERWGAGNRQDLEEKTKMLEATVASLQKKNAEAKRLNARVENKLYVLEDILGAVSEEKKTKNDKQNQQKGLFKPASLSLSSEAHEKSPSMIQQRRNLQKLDHIVRQLKGLPLKNPVPGGVITSRFGYRQSPFGQGARFHHGVDISTRGNLIVKAAGDGIVKSVGYNTGYGLVVDIQHSRNVVTRYAHLSYAKVKAGQRVKAGELIAAGGSTGRATGRHLHYEVRVRGRSQNPEIFMNLSRKIQMVLKGSATAIQG